MIDNEGMNLSLIKKLQIALDIVKGIEFMHSMKLIHRDIKSANIVMSNDYHAFITDFGNSKFINDIYHYNNRVQSPPSPVNSPRHQQLDESFIGTRGNYLFFLFY